MEIELPAMQDFSAFLIPWDSITGLFGRDAFVGVGALFILLIPAWLAVHRFNAIASFDRFLIAILLACGLSIVAVLFMQLGANLFYEKALAGDIAALNIVSWKHLAAHPKAGLAELAILLMVGGGYAFSAVETALPWHMLSFSVGIGVLEEIGKALVAIYLFHRLASSSGVRQVVLVFFALSGLAFGAGEALHYFGAYANEGKGLSTYLIRAWLVVPLHAAWSIIAGHRILDRFGDLPKLRDVAMHRLLLPAFPVIVLHGLYDALLLHGLTALAAITVIASLAWAIASFSSASRPIAAQA